MVHGCAWAGGLVQDPPRAPVWLDCHQEVLTLLKAAGRSTLNFLHFPDFHIFQTVQIVNFSDYPDFQM